MLPDHPPAQLSPITTADVGPGPLVTQTIVLVAPASSAGAVVHAILSGMSIPPPGASTTRGKSMISAIQSGGNGGGGSDERGSLR